MQSDLNYSIWNIDTGLFLFYLILRAINLQNQLIQLILLKIRYNSILEKLTIMK